MEQANSDQLPKLIQSSSKSAAKVNLEDSRQTTPSKKGRSLKLQNPYSNISNELLPPIKKPENAEYWVRVKDNENDSIYYFNTVTQESSWLAPCSICYKTADRWCLQCNLSYCDKHFIKKHFPGNEHTADTFVPEDYTIDRNELKFHQWSVFELDQKEPLKEGEEYCINCEKKPALKLCVVCWDPYCNKCFDIVHHLGALKEHKALNIKRAKLAWYAIRKKSAPLNSSDLIDYCEEDHLTYVNGFTGEQTVEKPTDLMSDLERILLQNWKTHQKAMEDYSKIAQDLEIQLEIAQKEKDKVSVQRAQLANQIKQKLEEAKKKGKKG